MRSAVLLLALSCCARAQFKGTAQLVVVPVTVTDSKGHYVDGLTQDDLLVYDNSVAQPVQMDWMTYPISLVVAVQTSANSGAVIDKLGGTGILFSQLLAADAGETALLSFSDNITVRQDFTSDAEPVIHSLRMLRKDGSGARMLDAMLSALHMLEQRPAGRRRILLMIAEKRDRGSEAKLADVMARVQQQNVTIYWLTFSPFLQPFTVKPKTMEDLKPEAERIKVRQCLTCPPPDERPAPPDVGPGGYIYALGELFRLSHPDLSALFTDTTGGRSLSFLKKNALEHTIQQVGEEVHRQYILNFQPKNVEPGQFHAIRVPVKNRADLVVTARSGYWAVQ
jgi:VWFA-related protein